MENGVDKLGGQNDWKSFMESLVAMFGGYYLKKVQKVYIAVYFVKFVLYSVHFTV